MRVAFSLDLGGGASWFNRIRVIIWGFVGLTAIALLLNTKPPIENPWRGPVKQTEIDLYHFTLWIGGANVVVPVLLLSVYIFAYQTSPPAGIELLLSASLSVAWIILEYRANRGDYYSRGMSYARDMYTILLAYSLYVGIVAGRAQRRGVEKAWLVQVHALPEQGRIALPTSTDDVENGNSSSAPAEGQ